LPGIDEFIERRDILTDAKEQSETSPGLSEVFLIDFEMSQAIQDTIDPDTHGEKDKEDLIE